MNEILYIATSIAQLCIVTQNPIHCTNHMSLCLPRQAELYPDYQVDGWLENCIEGYNEDEAPKMMLRLDLMRIGNDNIN